MSKFNKICRRVCAAESCAEDRQRQQTSDNRHHSMDIIRKNSTSTFLSVRYLHIKFMRESKNPNILTKKYVFLIQKNVQKTVLYG